MVSLVPLWHDNMKPFDANALTCWVMTSSSCSKMHHIAHQTQNMLQSSSVKSGAQHHIAQMWHPTISFFLEIDETLIWNKVLFGQWFKISHLESSQRAWTCFLPSRVKKLVLRSDKYLIGFGDYMKKWSARMPLNSLYCFLFIFIK